MFSKIFTYEILFWFKKPSFYLYLLAYTGIAFIAFIGSAGFFDGPEPAFMKNPQLLNSPAQINDFFQYYNKLFLFLLPTIIGSTVYKDFKNNTHSILYTFPIEKSHYFFGKFLSSFLIVALITISVTVSLIIAEHIPGLHQNKIGEFSILGYLRTLFVFTIPNMLIIGSIVFSVVIYFRNIYTGFLVIIGFFFLQNISQNIFGGSGFLIALFDPFAENTVLYETQFWTLADKNTRNIPITGVVLYNRLIWLTISILITSFIYKKFTFSEHGKSFSFRKKKGTTVTKNNFNSSKRIQLSKVGYSFSLQQQLKNSWKLSTIYFQFIVKSWMFYGMVFLGILAILFTIAKITNNNDVTILPTTNVVLTIPAFFFSSIIMLLTFIYSGMLVHRNQTSKMNQLIDTTPVSNWELLISNLLALIKMQFVLLLIMMIVGISIQTYNGYYHYEIDLYLFNLFIIQFLGLLIWAFMSVFVHTCIKNTYLGIFALIMIWLGVSGIKEMGIDTKLILFNFSEPLQYSDINGYGNAFKEFFIVKAYWLAFSLILVIVTYSLWLRGNSESIKDRWQQAILRIRQVKGLRILFPLFLIAFLGFGFTIYNQERTLKINHAISQNEALGNFKTEFDSFKNIQHQPKITDVSIDLDIYPSKENFYAKGAYILVNKTSQKIDTLLIKTGFDEITSIDLNVNYNIIKQDDYFHFYAIQLEKALSPNDSIVLSFEIQNTSNTLFERNSNVLKNGTFLKKDILPRVGYFLSNSVKNPEDSSARKNQLGTLDADFVNFNGTLSTSKNQIAIAPGELQKKWTKDNRNYFTYRSSQKMKFGFAFISSEFEIKKEDYKGISLEFYYHKNHPQNIVKMSDGLKASLDYNNRYFGDYAYKNIKVIEFPMSEGIFATIMGNTIPTSERRFISNSTISAEERFDPSFKVQAHELTHHWWGNKLVHGNALGASMLSESITDYITLKVYEHHYGKKSSLDFLKLQHRRYLRGRVSFANEEPPLYLAKSSDIYLSYGKGSIAFYTLSHYLGEEKLNGILKSFLDEYSSVEGNYPTSLDILKKIKQATPDSLQYLVKDYFEDTIFYDTKINAANVTPNNNRFDVDVDFNVSKHRKNNTKKLLSLNDYIQLGFYDKDDKLIEIKALKVNQFNNKQRFSFSKEPVKVVVDPYYLLIDKNRRDNNYKL